jgi:hypothetical protein
MEYYASTFATDRLGKEHDFSDSYTTDTIEQAMHEAARLSPQKLQMDISTHILFLLTYI